MKAYLTPLIQLQRFFLPALICLTLWAIWRLVIKRDAAVGLALYLGVAIIVDSYLNTGIYLPGLEKGSIRYSELCALALLIDRPYVSERRTPWTLVLLPVWVYFGLMFLSTLRSDNVVPAIMEFRALIVPQLVALLVARRGLKTPEDFRRFLIAFSVVVLFVGIWDFWDVFFDRTVLKSDVLDKPIYFHNREKNRFGSIFLNPNYLGAFVVLVMPLFFMWAMREERLRVKVLAWASLALLLFCQVETQSRAPLLALGLSIPLLVLGPCGTVSRKRRLGFLLAGVVAVMLVMPGFLIRASGRFDRIEEETKGARSREVTWAYTIRMIRDRPLLGIGFGEEQFMSAMRAYGFEYRFGVESLDAPHNSYLQAAVYAGVPALLAFLAANATLLMRAVAMMSRRTDPFTPTAFGLFVGIVGFLLTVFPDLQLFTPNVAQVYWVFFGLLLSLVTGMPETATDAQTLLVPARGGVHEAVRAWGATEPMRQADPFRPLPRVRFEFVKHGASRGEPAKGSSNRG